MNTNEQRLMDIIDEAERDSQPRVFSGPPHGSIDHKRMYPDAYPSPTPVRKFHPKVVLFGLLVLESIAVAMLTRVLDEWVLPMVCIVAFSFLISHFYTKVYHPAKSEC